nr:alginate export family protein [uncultured Neokomagataea sp.]
MPPSRSLKIRAAPPSHAFSACLFFVTVISIPTFAHTAEKTPQSSSWLPGAPHDRPPVQDYPHAGFVGQPRRVLPSLNRPTEGHQGPWGAFNYGTGEAAGFGPVGRYGIAPWAEDWSNLRNPHTSDDALDPLKFIALNPQKTIWLTLSGETRLRNWAEEAPFLGRRGNAHSGRFMVRNLLGADLHLGEHVRLFGQLVNGDAAGWKGFGYNQTFRKRLDAQQAFIELKGQLAGARTGLIVGRQQFLDAPSYILYNRETPNVPLSWNGTRFYAFWPKFRLDTFDFAQTNTNPTKMFHDTIDWGTRLYGTDGTAIMPTFTVGSNQVHSFFDVFYLRYRYASSLSAVPNGKSPLTGTSSRGNIGARWYGTARDFEFSLGGLYQNGTFQYANHTPTSTVSAWAINTIAGYRHTPSTLHPFIGAQFDLYSGGKDGHSPTIHTYMSPYNPQTTYSDPTTYLQPSNLISLSPVISITPFRGYASLRLKAPVLWRENMNGAIWNSSGPFTFTHPYHGRFVGVEPQAFLLIQLQRHLTWQLIGARFITSNGLHKAGGQSGSFFQSNLVFRF